MNDTEYDNPTVVTVIRLVLVAMGAILLLFAGATLAVFPPVSLFAALIGIAGVRLIASGLVNKWPPNGGWVSWMVWRLVVILLLFGALARMSERKLQEPEAEK